MSKRKPAAARQRTAADEAYARLAVDICDLLRALAPPEEALGHFRTARMEVLKGMRAVLDSRIERLSAERQKGTPVTID
jgi:hypothetical protein